MIEENNIQIKISNEYVNLLMKDVKDPSLKMIAKNLRIKYDDAFLFFPYKDKINNKYFIKIFLNGLDQKVLKLLQQNLKGEKVSLYEGLLEGIILRFEELLKYKKVINKLSSSLNQKIFNFKLLFMNNHLFMNKLLILSGDKDSFAKNNFKAIMLNALFIKYLNNIISQKDEDIDTLIRKIDNDLKILFDFKFLFKN